MTTEDNEIQEAGPSADKAPLPILHFDARTKRVLVIETEQIEQTDAATFLEKTKRYFDWKRSVLENSKIGPPSAEIEQLISETLRQYVKEMPLADYRAITSTLAWPNRQHFDERLSQMAFTITGAVKGPDGQDLAALIPALEICGGYTLFRFSGHANNPSHFRHSIETGDELLGFSSSAESWKHLAGRSGLALVRGNIVIEAYITVMN